MLAALLSDARPVAVEERELTLALPGRRRVPQAQGRAGRLPARGGEALKAVTGRRLALRYELARRRGGAGRARRCSQARSSCDASWRSSTPKRSSKTIPNEGEARADAPTEHAADPQAGPEDAAGHARRPGGAQGRGRRGLGRWRHGHGRRSPATWSSSRSRSTPRRSIPTTSSCSRTWSWPRSTRGSARPRSSPRRSSAGSPAGWRGGLGDLGLPGLGL